MLNSVVCDKLVLFFSAVYGVLQGGFIFGPVDESGHDTF